MTKSRKNSSTKMIWKAKQAKDLAKASVTLLLCQALQVGATGGACPAHNIPGSSNGRTLGSGPRNRGSNPCPGAI